MNILESIPESLPEELTEDILNSGSIRIERIVSRGQSSPAEGWYDQDENEWVMVAAGAGRILFEDGREILLSAGDYINIPRHSRHRVSWTDPRQLTVWLAVFYP